jgi:hypothetical protein
LKARRKLKGYKDEDVKNRSLHQRRKKIWVEKNLNL